MRDLNYLAFDIAQRAERSTNQKLQESFVDVGSIFKLVSKEDNQIVFGRRGTGKTHLLKVLYSELRASHSTCVYLDMRMLGSTGGIFSDSNLPQANRAARLLCDTLCEIHGNLLKQVLSSDIIDQSILIPLLDEFIELSTTIEVEGAVGYEISDSYAQSKKHSSANQLSIKPNLRSSDTSNVNSSNNYTKKFKTSDTRKVHFGSITKVLNKVIEYLPNGRLWVLIDEWSEVPLDLQPYLAEMLKRCFSPITTSTIKIAAVVQRSKFNDVGSSGVKFGMEVGADISARLNLDDFLVLDDGNEKSINFFKELIFKHIKSVDADGICPETPDLMIKELFTQQSNFIEFVRAAEGVPRDAIHILGDSALKSADKPISILNIREAARDWFNRNKVDSLTGMKELIELLDWILNEVIGKRSSRGFLIDQKQNSALIDQLYDARIIHLIKKGISAKNLPGKRFDLYSIDYGCYAELMSTSQKPTALLTEAEGSEIISLTVPLINHRVIRNSILDLELFNKTNKLPLFSDFSEISVSVPDKESKSDDLSIPVPESFIKSLPPELTRIYIEHSIHIAAIFGALRWRLEQGIEYTKGADLTKVINMHLLCGDSEKQPTNISRTLRDERTLKLPWLVLTESVNDKLFSLSEDWEVHWNNYFPQESLGF